jgi:hypothetical protein
MLALGVIIYKVRQATLRLGCMLIKVLNMSELECGLNGNLPAVPHLSQQYCFSLCATNMLRFIVKVPAVFLSN